MSASFETLPAGLPRPVDDGACDHLPGMAMPPLSLPSTAGGTVDLAALPMPRTVIFCYPLTGVPGKPLPTGWDEIPGARGCTPEACSFRDQYGSFTAQQAEVYGFSTQTTEYQQELAQRLHLPYAVLSDARFELVEALRLPTFEADGVRLVRRLTLVVRDGRIETVFYPVFPSDRAAAQTLKWLEVHPL